MWLLHNHYIYNTTTAGFEPARAKPNGFQDHLLNHSDTLSIFNIFIIINTLNTKTHLSERSSLVALINYFLLLMS